MRGLGGKALRVGDAFSELMWPTRCLGCDLPGELLCDECRAKLPWIDQRWACPVCGAPYSSLTCTQCDRSREREASAEAGAVHEGSPLARRLGAAGTVTSWPMRTTVCSCSFQDAAASMVLALKDAHELRLAPVMAAAMACALDEASSWDALDGRPRYDEAHTDVLCFVPATSSAYARRGFDHMELVSRALSGFLDVPLLDALVRADAQDQRLLGKEGREENLAGSIDLTCDVAGLHVLLADDVITTGASLREATRALLARGAASVTACTFARVW